MPPGDRRILAAHPNAPDSGLACGYRKLIPSWKRENLVCMPTLSVGETDRGNHSVAIQRRSESQSGECEGQSGVSSRRDCFAIVAEVRLTLSVVASGVVRSGEARKRVHRRDFSAWRTPSPIPTCQMGSGALVVGKIIFQSPAQRSFIPHDDVV